VNEHMLSSAQASGWTSPRSAGRTGQLGPGALTNVEDFFSWGERVLAPADGTVVSVVNDQPDNPLGTKDAEHPGGNYVVHQSC